MAKPQKMVNVFVKEFISTKEGKTIDNFPEFLKYGAYGDFVFKYVVEGDKKQKVRTSTNIRLLNMYEREIHTRADGVVFKILNDID